MSSWNYRIIEYASGHGYGLHEVYHEAGSPYRIGMKPTTFVADTATELLDDLSRALSDASVLPVIQEPTNE